MADRAELLRQLQELKALRAQLVDSSVNAPAKKEPSFGDTAFSLEATGKSLGKVASGVWDTVKDAGWAARGFLTDPGTTLHDAATLPFDPGFYAQVVEGVGGAIPGVTPAARYLADKVGGVNRTPAEYGQMVNQDLTNTGVQLATMGLSRGLLRRGANGEASASAAETAISDPSTKAALRYAQNRGLLETPSAKQALEKGKITPEIQDAARLAQQEAKYSARPSDPNLPDVPAQDFLPGSMVYPESSASTRPFAAAQELADQGPSILESNIYQGSPRINPYTGKFDGPPLPPKNHIDLMNRAVQAQADLIPERRTIVENVDKALNTVNQQSPGMPKIRGIMWDTDLSPMLSDLKGVVERRKMLLQTAPEAGEMAGAMAKVEHSLNSIQNKGLMSRWNKIGPNGTREMGELLPSEMLSLVEDMNAYRRALGEFDEAARVRGLNSTFSDATGRGAELYSLKEVQKVAQSALENKMKEVLSHAPNVKGYHGWMDVLQNVTPETLPGINKSYGAMANLEEAMRTYDNSTMRGTVSPEPNRLITGQLEGNNQATNAAGMLLNPKATMIQAGARKLFGVTQPNMPISRGMANMRRPEAAVTQVIDGLLLRNKPVPILSRDWNKVRVSPDALAELDARAVAMGLAMPGAFYQLPEPQRKLIHAQVVITNPQAAESVPGNYHSVVTGKFLDPEEMSSHQNQAMELPAKYRAKILGAMGDGGKFVPLPNQEAKPELLPLKPLGDIGSLLPDVSASPDLTSDQSSTGIIDQMRKSMGQHDATRSGL